MVDSKNAECISLDNDTRIIQVKLNSMDYNSFLLFISALKTNYFRFQASRPRKPRTTGWKSQNHHFNGHIQQICKETGVDKFKDFQYVKMQCKYDAIPRGYGYMIMRDGTIVPKSEADADTIECAILIDTAHQLAAELNITLKERKYDEN